MAKTTKNKRRGRPPKSSGDLKKEYLDVRLDLGEKQAFWDAANIAMLGVMETKHGAWYMELTPEARKNYELFEQGNQLTFG